MIILKHDKSLKERILDRQMWPSDKTQFCTSYQKRDTYSKWVRSLGPGHYLCVSGERAEESSRRASKPIYQIYKSAHAPTKQRHVDWFRPIHHLMIDQVWKLMSLANTEPHPCYEYVSRCSCKFCIYLSPKEMKTVAELFPKEFQEFLQMEQRLGHTMKWENKEPLSLKDFIAKADVSHEQMGFEFFKPCQFI